LKTRTLQIIEETLGLLRDIEVVSEGTAYRLVFRYTCRRVEKAGAANGAWRDDSYLFVSQQDNCCPIASRATRATRARTLRVHVSGDREHHDRSSQYQK
jgi:hypothetical protein